MNRFLFSLCLLLTTTSIGLAQTPFQNLDFEGFTLNPSLPVFPNPPPTAQLTGWGISNIGFASNLGLGPEVFLDTNAPIIGAANGSPLAGITSIVLGTGFETLSDGTLVSPTTPEDIGISQTGFVPATSRSIQILASQAPIQQFVDLANPNGIPLTLWTLSLGGNDIQLTETSPGQWAGNIVPSLAGTSQELAIDINSNFVSLEAGGFQQQVSFDNISFSSQVVGVPEPSSTLVLVTGLLGLVSRRRRPYCSH